MPTSIRAAGPTSLKWGVDLAAALLEERRRVEADYVNVMLALGRPQEVLASLKRTTTIDPLAEDPAAHFMRALYLAGRKPEALEAFSRCRGAMIQAFGTDRPRAWTPCASRFSTTAPPSRTHSGRPLSCGPRGRRPVQAYTPMMSIRGVSSPLLAAWVGAIAPRALCLMRLLTRREAKRLLHSEAEPGARVAAGLRVFSEVVPPWWSEGGEDEIDPDTLDMLDPLRNLLAQRFGSVRAGLERLNLTEQDGIACGFIARDAEDAIQLRRLWLMNLFTSRIETRAFFPVLDRPSSPDDGPTARSRWYL